MSVKNRDRTPGVALPRDAERLLAALGAPGAHAFPDPLDAEFWVVRKAEGGVSLGGGRFRREAGRALASAGLAAEDGRGALRIAEAGRARLRRAAAAPGEAFLGQHLDLEDDSAEPGGSRVRRDAAESPLAWLHRRRDRAGVPLVGAAAFEAGERLRRDLTAAALMPRVTVDWEGTGAAGGPRDPAAASDTVIAARQRVGRALDAVGDDLSGLLIDLCGFLKGIETIERERRWPPRAGKVVVNLALGRLARHYGLADEASGPERGRIRLWRDEG